jgi:predicted house-cleaning noncanonical NTP pyrophosphatase (MazG superfamily)
MINNVFLMSCIADIQTDIEYLKKVTTKLQEAVNELKEINDMEDDQDNDNE